MNDSKTILASFVTEEHKHYHRSNDFYWTVGLVAIVVCVLAFIFRSGLFGILIIISAAMYGYVSWKKPNEINVIVTDKDISIGSDIYPVSSIESFHILDLKGEDELVLLIKRSYQPIISISVPDQISTQLRPILSDMIKEDEKLMPHIGRRFMARYKI